MKLTLTSVQRFDKDRNGNPLMTSKGKPYKRCVIKAIEYGDKTLSGFGNSDNDKWTPGMVVDLEVTQKGEYLNFAQPRKAAPASPEIMEKLTKIEKTLEELSNVLLGGRPARMTPAPVTYPGTVISPLTPTPVASAYPAANESINPDDIPF